jgi:hypothetical protein
MGGEVIFSGQEKSPNIENNIINKIGCCQSNFYYIEILGNVIPKSYKKNYATNIK